VATAVTSFQNLIVVAEPPAARVTLNRPEKRNALSLELMEELIAALNELGANRQIRAIVVEGAGPAFSAGHDLGEMVGREPDFYQGLFDVCTVPYEILGKPIEQIASWRDHGGQWFWRDEEIDIAAGGLRVERAPSCGTVESLPTSIEATYEWLKAFETSKCDLGGGQGRAEGVVARTADRKTIAKLRFEDYERTLGVKRR